MQHPYKISFFISIPQVKVIFFSKCPTLGRVICPPSYMASTDRYKYYITLNFQFLSSLYLDETGMLPQNFTQLDCTPAISRTSLLILQKSSIALANHSRILCMFQLPADMAVVLSSWVNFGNFGHTKNERTNEWTNERANERTNEWRNERIKKINAKVNVWIK